MWTGWPLEGKFSETGSFGKESSLEHRRLKTCAYKSTKIDKESENSAEWNNAQKIKASMERMSSNVERPGIYFGDRSQLIHWIVDSGSTYHMELEI